MIIKVCGMREPENIRQVEALGIDWMGFIFYEKSPRHVSEVPSYMPQSAKRIGVFVNSKEQEILTKVKDFKLSGIQLHGNESPEFCASIRTELPEGVMINKAFGLRSEEDLEHVKLYEGTCDFYVFDTQTKSWGGSGKRFDWSILKRYEGQTRFLLSGGLSPENIDELLAFHHEKMVGIDINSMFEISPALKDIQKISSYIIKIKEYEQNKQTL